MRPHLRSLLAPLFAAALLLGAAGCGDDDDPEATGSGDTTEDSSDTTSASDYGGSGGDASEAPDNAILAKDFKLSDLTVGPGEDIVLQNDDGTKHTATADDGAFDLEADGGETSDPTAAPDDAGTFAFHCQIHPNMTATLTVEG